MEDGTECEKEGCCGKPNCRLEIPGLAQRTRGWPGGKGGLRIRRRWGSSRRRKKAGDRGWRNRTLGENDEERELGGECQTPKKLLEENRKELDGSKK